MSGRLSGMTGFARVEGALDDWSWAIEARSVNGRNLEVRFRAPPGFESLDRIVREAAQARLQRGQVSVHLQARRAERAAAPQVNTPVLETYLALARDLVERGAAPPSADGLLALRGVLEAEETEPTAEARAALEAATGASLEAALEGLREARLAEGRQLTPVLTGFVDRIAGLVADAEAEAATQAEAVRERFVRRMAELAPETADFQDRIHQEAALLAARADVREELDRLHSHVASARALLSAGGAVGRKLDFLMQEFMREANTLCSKSATTALISVGLDLKAVIEQLREQVQNVE